MTMFHRMLGWWSFGLQILGISLFYLVSSCGKTALEMKITGLISLFMIISLHGDISEKSEK